MVDNGLVQNITERFKQGQNSSQIKEALREEGYAEADIDTAFRHIRHTAFQQIPIVAAFSHWLEGMDSKTSNLFHKVDRYLLCSRLCYRIARCLWSLYHS